MLVLNQPFSIVFHYALLVEPLTLSCIHHCAFAAWISGTVYSLGTHLCWVFRSALWVAIPCTRAIGLGTRSQDLSLHPSDLPWPRDAGSAEEVKGQTHTLADCQRCHNYLNLVLLTSHRPAFFLHSEGFSIGSFCIRVVEMSCGLICYPIYNPSFKQHFMTILTKKILIIINLEGLFKMKPWSQKGD